MALFEFGIVPHNWSSSDPVEFLKVLSRDNEKCLKCPYTSVTLDRREYFFIERFDLNGQTHWVYENWTTPPEASVRECGTITLHVAVRPLLK